MLNSKQTKKTVIIMNDQVEGDVGINELLEDDFEPDSAYFTTLDEAVTYAKSLRRIDRVIIEGGMILK